MWECLNVTWHDLSSKRRAAERLGPHVYLRFVREREHRRLPHEIRHSARPHGMCLSQQLLELVDLRPDDVDPPVAHPLVRSERERTAPEDEDVFRRLQLNGIEQRLLHVRAAHP